MFKRGRCLIRARRLIEKIRYLFFDVMAGQQTIESDPYPLGSCLNIDCVENCQSFSEKNGTHARQLLLLLFFIFVLAQEIILL